MGASVRVGKQGRIVLPSGLREAVRVREGDVLLAEASDGRIVLTPAEVRPRRHA